MGKAIAMSTTVLCKEEIRAIMGVTEKVIDFFVLRTHAIAF
jgi:hypothetical protein